MTTQQIACDYCQLPIAATHIKPGEKVYCCFGCRLAAQITGERGGRGAAQWMLARLGMAIFLSMNVMMLTMALWTSEMSSDKGGTSPLAAALADLFRYLCLVLSLPVLWLLGKPLFDNAWSLRQGRTAATDLLILLGVIASFCYSAHSVIRGGGHIYFEVGCAVLIMVTLGRWLEATGKIKTTESLDALEKLLPDRVKLVESLGPSSERQPAATGDYRSYPLADVIPGDLLLVAAGERIPVDGRLIQGRAHVDEQILTGESQPIAKQRGDAVLEGTLNIDGELLVQATRAANQGTWARLIELVREGRARQGHYQRLTERIARRFLPLVLTIAGASFAYHLFYSGIEAGLLSSLAVLLIACPCALGLATPMAISAAFGTALGHQVLFRGGEALERLAAARALYFDKTGTLTTGSAQVTRLFCADEEQRTVVLRRAAAMTCASAHPFAQAIQTFTMQYRGSDSVGAASLSIQNVPGRGLAATTEARATWLLGSPSWMEESGVKVPEALRPAIEGALARGEPLSLLAGDGQVQGVFVFEEHLRSDAAAALAACRVLGCEVYVLTGDHERRAAVLAEQLKVTVSAQLLPEDKVNAIGAARHLGPGIVMVGDGLNDAPAMAASDVGIALGCGSDLARESAGVCLLGNQLQRVPWSIDLARRTVSVIRQNLFWAFAYNGLGMALAAAGYLNPGWAALAMVASSVLVIANSLRLSEAAPVLAATSDSIPPSPGVGAVPLEYERSRDTAITAACA